MSEKINEALEILDDSDMAEVEAFVQRLADAKRNRENKVQTPPQKHGGKKGIPAHVAKKIQQKREQQPLDNSEDEPIVNGQRRKRPAQGEGRRGQQPQRRGKKYGPKLPLETGPRPNKFLASPDFNANKADVDIDRKLSGKNRPTARKGQQMVEAMCTGCRFIFDVLPHLVYRDDDEGLVFICHECSKNQRQ